MLTHVQILDDVKFSLNVLEMGQDSQLFIRGALDLKEEIESVSFRKLPDLYKNRPKTLINIICI